MHRVNVELHLLARTFGHYGMALMMHGEHQ